MQPPWRSKRADRQARGITLNPLFLQVYLLLPFFLAHLTSMIMTVSIAIQIPVILSITVIQNAANMTNMLKFMTSLVVRQ